MKLRHKSMSLLVAGVGIFAAGFLLPALASAQDEPSSEPPFVTHANAAEDLSVRTMYLPDSGTLVSAGVLYFGDQRIVEQAIRAYSGWLKSAKSQEQKSVAKQRLKVGIEKVFDRDLANREKEIAAISERVKKLQGHLEKRRAARAEIVDLQIKLIELEAKGLELLETPRRVSPANQANPFGGDRSADPFDGAPANSNAQSNDPFG